MDEEEYANIREVIPTAVIGSTVVDITQHDQAFFDETGKAFVQLMFSTGDTIRFYIGDDGIEVNLDGDEEDEDEEVV